MSETTGPSELYLGGDTLLFTFSEWTSSQDHIEAMLSVLGNVYHPKADAWREAYEGIDVDEDGEGVLMRLETDLMDACIAITPKGYRFTSGYRYGSEAGWVGWVQL
jgi:hypothetical protein